MAQDKGLRRAQRKWPIHGEVRVWTTIGYMTGKIARYYSRHGRVCGPVVAFFMPVTVSDSLPKCYEVEVPFRNAKRVPCRNPYGRTKTGEIIVAREGWRILPEGERVPPHHMECTDDGIWCAPRRGHSTMTPWTARTSGYVRAIAVPC